MVLVIYAAASIFFAWKLVRRWLWEAASQVVEVIEETSERGALPPLSPPADMSRLLNRLDRALEKHRSASKGIREIEAVRVSVERLCEEIEQMGLRHFDRDFSDGKGALAPLGDYLADCCAELSSFVEGCKSVVTQISETMRTAQETAGVLASRAERAFVGHGEVSVGIKDLSKRVQDISRLVEESAAAAGGGGESGPGAALERIDEALEASLDTAGRMRGLDEDRDAISSDTKRLADEATVIALNAAIEASRSGSKDLQNLAENARRLAEGSMAACEKVEALSARYGDTVTAVTGALDGLRSGIAEWRKASGSGGPAAELERFVASLRGFAASLAEKSEEMARLSEATSSQAQDARKATEEALREVQALMMRLGAGGAEDRVVPKPKEKADPGS
jgi:methyl-accepting chemotaxis protein